MKPGTMITRNKLPRDNGRPQLWIVFCAGELNRVRILYPNGDCWWLRLCAKSLCPNEWNLSCFIYEERRSTFTMKEVQQQAVSYDKGLGYESYFGGYL